MAGYKNKVRCLLTLIYVVYPAKPAIKWHIMYIFALRKIDFE